MDPRTWASNHIIHKSLTKLYANISIESHSKLKNIYRFSNISIIDSKCNLTPFSSSQPSSEHQNLAVFHQANHHHCHLLILISKICHTFVNSSYRDFFWTFIWFIINLHLHCYSDPTNTWSLNPSSANPSLDPSTVPSLYPALYPSLQPHNHHSH